MIARPMGSGTTGAKRGAVAVRGSGAGGTSFGRFVKSVEKMADRR